MEELALIKALWPAWFERTIEALRAEAEALGHPLVPWGGFDLQGNRAGEQSPETPGCCVRVALASRWRSPRETERPSSGVRNRSRGDMDSPRLQILHTPATLASDHEAGAEIERLRAASAGGKGFGSELLAELRSGSWLGGEAWRRGGYFTTSGLLEAAGHPELALLNVPGAFAPMAQQLLSEVGEYLLKTGARLGCGEVLALTHPSFAEMFVTFEHLAPGELASPEFGREMVLVLPLP